jgi:APA family basic amino acid/polyamine antiporter
LQTVKEPSSPQQRGRLLQILGVGFGLAVIIGNTIGAGILRTPGEVATHLPDIWLFIGVWIAGGLYALLGALSIAELGTTLPRSGGQYVFAHYALGDYAGFVVGWSDWISTCGSSAFIALVIGEYAGKLFPVLEGRTVPVALAIVIGFGLLQWRGIRWGSGVQNLTSLLKTLAFIALIAACFALGGRNPVPIIAVDESPAREPLFVAIVLALQSVIYTYDGWTGVIYFSEEVRDYARDIPRAMFGGVLAVIAIYLLVNLAVLYVLPISQIAGSDLAVGAAANVIFGEHGDTIIRVLTILSMLSAINACQLMASRVLFAMSRDNLFSSKASLVNKGGTPTVTLFISTVVAVLFILSAKVGQAVMKGDEAGAAVSLSGALGRILAVVAFFFVFNYAISFAAVFVLRRREPDRARPYRAWGYPWTTGLTLLGSLAFLAGSLITDTQNSLYALALLAASYPTFHLLKRLARSKGGEP